MISVAFHSASPWLLESSPESSSDCDQTAFRRDTNNHLSRRSSPDSPSEGHIKRGLPLCAGFQSETRDMLSGTNSSLSLSGYGARHNLHVSCPAGGTYRSDTGSMPGNARVSENIPGWTVEPLRPHEPCPTDGTVDTSIILQSPAAPAVSAASPVRMETKVSDVRTELHLPRQVSTFVPGEI